MESGVSHTIHRTQVPLPSTHITVHEDDREDLYEDDHEVHDEDGDHEDEDDNHEVVHIIDGRYYIWPSGNSFKPSRTAAQCIIYVIQQKYKKVWKRFKDIDGKENEVWFNLFKGKSFWRPTLMKELVIKTRTKKSREFVDGPTKKALEDYQTFLTQFLVENPQYTSRGSEPLNPRVDFYIWDLVHGGMGSNGWFFGVGSLPDSLRKRDRTLFQRVRDGEGTSHP
ncbi:hypothetical protein KIW84_022241 [Lathyrus oleraceus]|uniref:Uncharacterized protein n=1 Tax=Pisum sativum TaxID=3888 RepID=A0A9D4YCN3_PEA|nr:hypothetical protein KIW84_022241 [Pisum sativum]